MADVVCPPVLKCGTCLKATILAWHRASERSLPNQEQKVVDEETQRTSHHRAAFPVWAAGQPHL